MRNLVGLGLVGTVFLLNAEAQTQARPSSAQIVVRGVPSNMGCPVDLVAQRTAAGRVAYAAGPGQASGENGVHVSLKAGEGARVREASLTVHALSARGRLLPALPADASDIARDFHLAAGKQGAPELSGDASVSGSATVIFVDVDELVYADGRVWRPGAGVSCRVEPDGLLPVASLR